jgi:hypothetical protein
MTRAVGLIETQRPELSPCLWEPSQGSAMAPKQAESIGCSSFIGKFIFTEPET